MKTVLGVTAALVCGVLSPTLASAQAYGSQSYGGGAYDQGYSYDACQRSTTNRATGGGLAGAGIGAVIGSNVAAHGRRTEGSVLGGLLGAVVGANIGKSSAACTPGQMTPPPPPPPPSAYNGSYDDPNYRQGSYGDTRRDAYSDGYSDRDYSRRDRYRVNDRSNQADVNGCTLAESPIYLPDGRVQKRFVRVCPDSNGKYQVVD